MMVGKIEFTYPDRLVVHKKGAEMGLFAFGGSTLVLIFKKNVITVLPQFIPKIIPSYKQVYEFYTNGGHDNQDPRPRVKVKLGQAVAKKKL
jgi:hypothetical protein